MIQKIALGTAQFGMDYGISNKRGKIPKEEISEILLESHRLGVGTLDTAAAYGSSEEVIGDICEKHNLNFEIVTKVKKGTDNPDSAIKKSLDKLKMTSIHGLLFHSFHDAISNTKLFNDFVRLKEVGLVNKLGISLYSESEATYILETNMPFEIVQIPYNVFDQRFKEVIKKMKLRGIEVHSRSTFLQGLFFLNMDEITFKFPSAISKINKLKELSRYKNIGVNYLLLGFALMNESIDQVVLGVESIKNLRDNFKMNQYLNPITDVYSYLEELRFDDLDVILPTNWTK